MTSAFFHDGVVTLTGRIEGKESRGRPQIKYLTSFSTWMAERVPEGQRG